MDIKLNGKNNKTPPTLFYLALTALGVVYGDIGTSPLYALRASLIGVAININDILGILSLILWSLILVISFKYLIVLLNADNEGEGGILALLALIKQFLGNRARLTLVIGIFGAGLMLGDGMLTPAISIISAIEGLYLVEPSLSTWIVPITLIILVALFSVQAYGSAKIGFVFGPIVVIWFLTIGLLGINQILSNIVVLKAINPLYAINFFRENGFKGYFILGDVFLVVTGGEALYADMGFFGKKAIRIGWFCVVLPGLLLNYFGQGAYLLTHPEAISNPFYLISPGWFLIPLVVLATIVTIIASQAVISATFSLTKQAVLLGLYPHIPIKQTSDIKKGHVYVPQMNFILALGTMLLIIIFKSSNALAHAYGIAVNIVMLLTSILVTYLAIKQWKWNPWLLILVFSFLGLIDLAFLGANIHKFKTGGWIPITFALFTAFIMYTWQRGMHLLRENYYMKKTELSQILNQINHNKINKLLGVTSIFITDPYDKSGGGLLHLLNANNIIPENVVLINCKVANIPYISSLNRYKINSLNSNICEITLRYGFMDTISIPQALYTANDRNILPFPIDIEKISYLIEIPNVVPSHKKKSLFFYWQEKIFAFLIRNYSANLNIEFYQVPFNRTIAIGTYYVI